MVQKSDTDMPLISVIMPAYNVEKYIGQAIESVLNQTYTNLELVICDDASTDRTCEIVKSYADPRIVLCHEESNTGYAYLPRYHAFQNSKGEIVVALDADDYVEERYLEKMYARLLECNADVCGCKMVWVDENGAEVGRSLPKKGFDYSLQLSGRDAFYKLVTEWSFGTHEAMAKREAWEFGFQRTYRPGKYEFGEDGGVGRSFLPRANKVVFCEAIRYYRQRTGSIMHTCDRRIFGWRTAAEYLLSLTSEEFGKDSREYKAAEHHDYVSYREVMIRFIGSIHTVPKEERRWYINEFKKWHDGLSWKEVREDKAVSRYDYIMYREGVIHFVKAIHTVPKEERGWYVNEFKKWHNRLNWREVREYIGYRRYLLHRNFYVEYWASLLWFRKRA